MGLWLMYMIVALYTDWAWICWVWFKALWCDCTAGSVIELFVHHHLCCGAGDCTADSVVELFIHCHLCCGAGDCTADLIVELFVCCCLCCDAGDCTADSVVELFVCHHLYCDTCWSVLTCGCTATAGGTGCEAGGSDAFLKTVNLKLCGTVVHGVSSGDMVGWYWHWGTETLRWSSCKAQFCSLNC